jgi:hypothetical protein
MKMYDVPQNHKILHTFTHTHTHIHTFTHIHTHTFTHKRTNTQTQSPTQTCCNKDKQIRANKLIPHTNTQKHGQIQAH